MPARTDSSFFSRSLNENAAHHAPAIYDSAVSNSSPQALLIGPSEGKSLGDLLRPHVFSRLFELESFRCAGLVSKDLTAIGGHQVLNFGEAALEFCTQQPQLIHMCGDSFLTGLISGYHRVAEDDEYNRFMSLVQITAREEMISYVKRRSGQNSSMAYVVAPKGCYRGAEVSFFGLRLPEPSVLEEEQEEHLVYCAGESSFLGVSGQSAESFFRNRGIECVQMPCALSVLPLVCGKPLAAANNASSLTNLRERFPNGWIALEVGSIPANDEGAIASAVGKIAAQRGVGIVIYSSRQLGESTSRLAKKWHALFGENQACWFESQQIWEITNVVAEAEFFVGGCLDSRILAAAFQVPRINTHPQSNAAINDYCDSWERPSMRYTLGESDSDWSAQLDEAYGEPVESLANQAKWSSEQFFKAMTQAFEATRLSAKFQYKRADRTGADAQKSQLATSQAKEKLEQVPS